MIVADRIAEVAVLPGYRAPKDRPEPLDGLAWIVYHAAGGEVPGFGGIYDVVALARLHMEHPDWAKVTGRLPYPLVIPRGGGVEQGAPLRAQTPHAKSYNAKSIGVAILMTRTSGVSDEQYRTLEKLAVVLDSIKPGLRHVTHSELGYPSATDDPRKVVGGALEDPPADFEVWRLRACVADARMRPRTANLYGLRW